MSSALRSKAQTPIGDVKFVSLITPYYRSPKYADGALLPEALLPFSMSRGELDLVETPDYLEYYADLSGSYPQPDVNGTNEDIDAWIYVMGGKRVVESLGVNLKRYISQWLEEKKAVRSDYSSRVSLHTRGCVVSKVQQYFISNINGTENAGCAYVSAVAPPTSENFVQGSEEDNYGTSYLFKTPLVMKYVKENGSVLYATFKTSIDED